jgi:hypothetical protein
MKETLVIPERFAGAAIEFALFCMEADSFPNDISVTLSSFPYESAYDSDS